jgi:hypothetical protein
MAEDPIKLFATRAERYPEQTDTDIAQGSARPALAGIPIIGGAVTEVLSMVLAPSVVRRRDQWFKELAHALDEIERKVEGFKVENLQNDESFVSAAIQATDAIRVSQLGRITGIQREGSADCSRGLKGPCEAGKLLIHRAASGGRIC